MRSKFNLSHFRMDTANMGQLIPLGMPIPVLPGDMIGAHTDALIRVTPLAFPVMHKVDVRIHHFYMANRNIWPGDESDSSWEAFITGGTDGMNTDTIPTINTTGTAKDLFDRLGIPPGAGAGIAVNSMPITMYNAIFNLFYRDQDLQTERTASDVTIANCCWEKDYFSTARPWASKGPQLSIPVGDSADVVYDNHLSGDDFTVYDRDNSAWRELATSGAILEQTNNTGAESNKLFVDLANASGADPLDVRRVWGLQRWAENAARYGNRYPEKMRQLGSHYRGLQDRPIYLGGGSTPLNFSEVLQTAEGSTANEGVGDMYGHGIAAMRTKRFAYMCPEHGYIMSLLSVRPKALYMDGVHREMLKTDREDFHDPYLEFIGQQPVWNGEVALEATGNQDTWGYSDKDDEYRRHFSSVGGEFRNTLDYAHLARDFSNTVPTLNGDFVKCDPSKRIFQEQTNDSLWIMAQAKVTAKRNVTSNPTARLL
ncbi:major capsid protein [Microviridae sp.]|nr:major capsid protein [Microviridae sp.]